MEPGEGPEAALIREVYEETGLEIEVSPRNLRVVHDLHPEGVEDICLFGVCRVTGGVLRNREVDKCDAMGWQDVWQFLDRERANLFLPLDTYQRDYGLIKTWCTASAWVRA